MATVATKRRPKVAAPAIPPLAPAEPVEQRVVLPGVRWETYEMLAQDMNGSRIHMTYDRGDLELMVLSFPHERYKVLLRQVVEVLAEELNVEYISAGSTTLQREDVAGAIEADDCFYFEHWRQVCGKEDIDLATMPPPDLGLEIDVTRSSLLRLNVYAALRIPEVWRFDGSALLVYYLRKEGQYDVVAESHIFPGVPLGQIPALIGQGTELADLAYVRLLRDWIRREVLPRGKARKAGPAKRKRPRR